jgi:c-di-GMP-binding flagellar brake protein YcgR
LLIILVSIAAAAVLVFAVVQIVRVFKRRKRNKVPKKTVWSVQRFHQKAMEAGFTAREAILLNEFALAAKLESPPEVLWSYKSLDVVIKLAMEKFRIAGKEKNLETQEFLGKLLDHRKRIIVYKLNTRKRLAHSREIPAGQEVQVVLEGIGIFTTKVSSHDLYFAVLSPIVFDLPPNFRWESRKVMIFFRKRNDGEYSFNTTVAREIEDLKTGEFVLLLYHQEALFRTQNRQSIRRLLNKQAHIIPIGDGIGRGFAESKPCTLYDISDDGCSVVVAGKMSAPLTVIVQFTLNDQLIGINGKCLSVQYNRVKNVSMLHINANSIPRDAKNAILSVIFGLTNEDDSPFMPDAPPESNGQAEPSNHSNADTGKPLHSPSPGETGSAETTPENPPYGNAAENNQATDGTEG